VERPLSGKEYRLKVLRRNNLTFFFFTTRPLFELEPGKKQDVQFSGTCLSLVITLLPWNESEKAFVAGKL
jgi:hypothetical protein